MKLKTHTNEYLKLKKEFENFEVSNDISSIEKEINNRNKLDDLAWYLISIDGLI